MASFPSVSLIVPLWILIFFSQALSPPYKKGDNGAAGKFKKHTDDYIALLEFHIDKENNVLFPLAIQHVSEEELSELKHGFDKIESEIIGHGTYERFHQMIEEFARLYM